MPRLVAEYWEMKGGLQQQHCLFLQEKPVSCCKESRFSALPPHPTRIMHYSVWRSLSPRRRTAICCLTATIYGDLKVLVLPERVLWDGGAGRRGGGGSATVAVQMFQES
jgi:hypothetical protein